MCLTDGLSAPCPRREQDFQVLPQKIRSGHQKGCPMKISPLTQAVNFLNQIRQRPDSESGHSPGGHAGEGHSDREPGADGQSDEKGEQRHAATETLEVTDEKVGAAITAFSKDAQTAANGLSASVSGSGPGLRVVLKDINGAVVRQFSGEEFLKLRSATAKDGRVRGKILDQKL